jgi:hypothetical protein
MTTIKSLIKYKNNPLIVKVGANVLFINLSVFSGAGDNIFNPLEFFTTVLAV